MGTTLLNNIKQRFAIFKNYDQLDGNMTVSEHFLNVFLVLVWFLLIEQAILSIFGNFINFLVTISCLFIASIFIFFVNIPRYLQIVKYYILIVFITALILWWFSGNGLTGPMPHYMAFIVFSSAIMFDEKEQKYVFPLLIVIFLSLSILEQISPSWVQDYEPWVKKSDIISAVLFVSFSVIFSFRYVKSSYAKKEQQIIKQYEESKLLNEELDNFVYRTSHDLRAPITSCLGLISLMKNNPNPEEIQKYLQLQEISLAKMDTFIQEVLNYSRNKHQSIQVSKVEFQDLYHEVIAQNMYVTNAQRIQFVYEEMPNAPAFYSDPVRLKMIFHNMINNSIRYQDTDKEKSYIKVKITHTPTHCHILFEDNGIGISKESLPKIFDMFYRGTKKAEGSGFGLYIVKQVVEKIGGAISCDSVLGEKTIFMLQIPNITHELP